MLRKVSLSNLEKIDLKQSDPIHPDWVRQNHPNLFRQMHHRLHGVEEFVHRGHRVRVTTTYKIEINGQEVIPHASVTGDGHVHCHSTPYTRYPSVADLVQSLINNTPAECVPQGGGGHGHDHGHSDTR